MSISTHPEPAAAALERACDEVDSLGHRLWAGVEPGEMVATVERFAVLRSKIAAVEAPLLAELDRQEVAKNQLAFGSTTDWLAHTAGITLGEAKRTLRDAHDLIGDRAETMSALADGVVSPGQASTICAAVADLPGACELRARGESELLAQARLLNGTDLRRAARYLVDAVDPDKAERHAEAELEREERVSHRHRFLSIGDDGAGGARIKGRCSAEDAATIRAALLPLSAPEPAIDPATGEPGERDPRDHGARTLDALVRLAQHALDTDVVPDSHGTKPRVSVTVALADLLASYTGDGATRQPALTDDGLRLSVGAVRRLACDAEIIPVVLGTEGQVLDVGRAYRTAPPAIWTGLVARDRHCAFPGCTRPPVMCHAHHIVHWADGGPTALSNLVLLCGHHHRTIHSTPWQIRLNPHDGRPEFLPPPGHRGQAERAWIRHRTRNHPLRE